MKRQVRQSLVVRPAMQHEIVRSIETAKKCHYYSSFVSRDCGVVIVSDPAYHGSRGIQIHPGNSRESDVVPSSSQDLLFLSIRSGRCLDQSRNRQTCCEIAAPAPDLGMRSST